MSGTSSTATSGETFVHYNERIPVRYCICGRRVEFYTNWKCNDAGRRFYRCGSQREQGCGNREWYDPPSCERANKIIPGLLRKLDAAIGNTSSASLQSDNATDHTQCKAKIRSLKKTIVALHAKNEIMTRVCFFLVIISGCLILIIWCLWGNKSAMNTSKFRSVTEL